MSRTMAMFAFAAVTLGTTGARAASYISAYAVSDPGTCGANDRPGTTSELQKLFASRSFPADLHQNFFWTDSKVKTADWGTSHDYFANTAAASGFDGSDSALVTYIASHGMTSGGRYM